MAPLGRSTIANLVVSSIRLLLALNKSRRRGSNPYYGRQLVFPAKQPGFIVPRPARTKIAAPPTPRPGLTVVAKSKGEVAKPMPTTAWKKVAPSRVADSNVKPLLESGWFGDPIGWA